MSKMEVPILQGVYADTDTFDIRYSLPKNLYPVAKSTGAGEGYLRQAEGAVLAEDIKPIELTSQIYPLVFEDELLLFNFDNNRASSTRTSDEFSLSNFSVVKAERYSFMSKAYSDDTMALGNFRVTQAEVVGRVISRRTDDAMSLGNFDIVAASLRPGALITYSVEPDSMRLGNFGIISGDIR